MRRLNSPVLLVLLVLVAACGDGGTTTPTSPPTPTAPPSPPTPPPPPPANRAPTASGTIGNQEQEAGVEVTVDVSGAFSDPDGDALTYTASSGNLDVATVSVSGSDVTVNGVAAGTATITVTATDPGGLSASQTFDVTVANQAPAAADTIEDQTVEAGAEVTVDVAAAFSDPDGDGLTYEATSDTPEVATVSVSGSDVTVSGVAAGTATVTVTATDPGGLSASQTFDVTVEAASDTNQAPATAAAIQDQTVEAGAEVTVNVSAAFSDPDGDDLTYEATSDAPEVATASVSGSDVTVSGVAAGTATVTVTATDPGGLSASQTFDVTVEAASDTNQAPATAAAIQDQTVEAGAEVTVNVSAAFSDPDGDDLTYEATSDAPEVATASVSGSEVTVSGVAAGTATITVTATDPGGLSASQTFDVTVEAGGAPDLDVLFAPPTAAEIAHVEADWATREPEVSEVNLELDMLVSATGPRVRVFSHTVGGIRHYGAVATPSEQTEAGSLPVVIVAHGETAGADGNRALQLNALLGLQGLTAALVIPSYRSEPLRIVGREFLSEGPASPWDLAVDDVLSLLSVALEEVEELDGERIAVLGDKGGGAVGLLAAARDDRIDVVVEISGPTDFFGEYAREVFEEALAGELRDLAGLEDLNEAVIQPWNRGELSDAEARLELVRRSPVYFVDRMPPVQLHHATGDMVVAVSQAERLIDAMDKAGKTEAEFEHNLYDGDSHGFNDLVFVAGVSAVRFARPFLLEAR
ncbi:MAG: putative Ig domain-containing protein [Gemmatimonadota bacterium]|nr:putative Ig domain-containing protein [Gemmatimonadota bacterium]